MRGTTASSSGASFAILVNMTIGIDLDSVVAEFMPHIINFQNKRNGTSFRLEDHTTYGLEKVWGVSRKEVLECVYDFYSSSHVDKIMPIKGSVEGIDYLSSKYELIIITSRPRMVKRKTHKWIKKYFNNKFSSVIHTNQFSKRRKNMKSKSQVCIDMGIKTIFEDHLKFAFDCSVNKINVYLHDMPWNQKKKLPSNMVRFFKWGEIRDYL